MDWQDMRVEDKILIFLLFKKKICSAFTDRGGGCFDYTDP
jgi:hypothetical protein